jgi:hypothetical protein
MPKVIKPSKFAAEVNAVPAVDAPDALDLILRRLDLFVQDARSLAADIEKHLKNDTRERQLLQASHRMIFEAAYGIEQAHLRNTMQI